MVGQKVQPILQNISFKTKRFYSHRMAKNTCHRLIKCRFKAIWNLPQWSAIHYFWGEWKPSLPFPDPMGKTTHPSFKPISHRPIIIKSCILSKYFRTGAWSIISSPKEAHGRRLECAQCLPWENDRSLSSSGELHTRIKGNFVDCVRRECRDWGKCLGKAVFWMVSTRVVVKSAAPGPPPSNFSVWMHLGCPFAIQPLNP